MVVQDMVVDLSAYIKRDNFDLDDFFPTSLDGYRFDKKLYGLPLTAPMSGFVYNMDMFDVAGIDYPDNEWTWDDVLAVARKLLKRDGAGRAQVFGITGFFGFFESNTSFTPIMWAYGGKLFDPIDFPIRSHVTSKEVIDSIAYVRDLRFKYRVAPMPGEQSRFSGVDYFIAGESAMAFSTPTLANTMKKAQSKIRWNATLMPKGPRGRGAGGNSAGMCILSSSRNPNAAWEFLKFLTSTEGFIIFDKALGSGATFPPRKSALKKVLVNYPDRNIDLNAYIESISFTLPFMYRTLPGCDIWSPIGDAISKIYSGQMDVLPAMKQINPVLETTLKKQAVELERYMR